MIPLTRDRNAGVIHQNFVGAKRIDLNFKLLKKKRNKELEGTSEKKWDSGVWKEAKDQLLIETHDKCAYCETPTKVVAYGDVEHFRPKSIYWWLAYSYENYLASCVICNQKYKKDAFPVLNRRLSGPRIISTMTDAKLKSIAPNLTVDPFDDTKGKPLDTYINEINGEFALVINPYFEDPSEYLAYKPILANKEIVVIPTKSKYKSVVEACEKYFGINRKELMDLRFVQYCNYMTFKHLLVEPKISGASRATINLRLNEMRHSKSSYAGMIRYFETKNLNDLPWDPNLSLV